MTEFKPYLIALFWLDGAGYWILIVSNQPSCMLKPPIMSPINLLNPCSRNRVSPSEGFDVLPRTCPVWAPRTHHHCWCQTSASSPPSPTKPCDSSSLPISLAFPSCTYLKGTHFTCQTCVFKWIWVTFPSFRLGPARCEHLVRITADNVEHLWRRLTQPNPKSNKLLPSRALDGSVEEEAKFHTRLQPYTQASKMDDWWMFYMLYDIYIYMCVWVCVCVCLYMWLICTIII